MSSVSTRLVRLLNMVPYFQANPRITCDEAAAELGRHASSSCAQDLDQLWMCGLPGYGPGDLIDFEFSGDTIDVTFSAGMDHPLRLTSPEATGILVALRALLEVPGMVDPEAARSAIAKIESAAGTATGAREGADAAVDEPAPIESEAAAAVRAAVRDGRALSIDYYSASHDTLSSRVVDPIRVVLVADHSYLEAWCRTAEGVRLFRFDRIVDARVLDEPSAPPEPAVAGRPDTSLFDARPVAAAATLLIDRSAAWMFDYYPLRVVRELPDGACEAAMTYASDGWMARFVLGFGSAVRVLEPQSLADRVRESAVAALEAYEVRRRRRATGRLVHDTLEVTKLGGLQPWHWLIVIAVFVLLFGAKKLPDAARSLGKSMRIFKSEIKEMQSDGKADDDAAAAAPPTPITSERVAAARRRP